MKIMFDYAAWPKVTIILFQTAHRVEQKRSSVT